MSKEAAPPPTFNPVTGEIIEQESAGEMPPPQVIMPAAVATGADIERLPENLTELAAYFSDPEPSPREVVQWIAGTSEMEESDPEDTMRSIMARILSQTTADGILTGHQVRHAQDILNVPLQVTGVKWQRSRIQGGSSCYAVITGTMVETSESVTITCSGRNVMTQLLAFQVHQLFPVRCRISQSSKPTEAGYYPLWMEPA